MASKIKVLTISDRFNRGGAAVISRKIHEYATKNTNFETKFLYGWDEKGFPNSSYSDNITTASYFFGPHLNAVACRVLGKNIFPSKKRKLETLIEWSDVIHIHNVHTYGFDYKQLFSLLSQYRKRIVITAHDDWYYTGRCAIRKNCEVWQNGCPKCPHLNYYHPTVFDNAKEEFITKTTLLRALDNCTFVAPSGHIADALSIIYPEKKTQVISNGIDSTDFFPPATRTKREEIKVLVVSNNFEDENKIDHPFMEKLIAENIDLHLVGTNLIYDGPNVTNYGFVKEAKKLGEIMQQADVMLFFSKVDSFGLILAEALCTGLYICAYDSRAAREVLRGFNKSIINENAEEFLNLIEDPDFIKMVKDHNLRIEQGEKAKQKYDQIQMLESYLQLYLN